MSTRDDRIAVPTNGTRPPAALTDDAQTPPLEAPSAEDPIDDGAEPPRIIVTPGQATVVGFGILAGLILLVLGRRRGKG